MPELSWTRRLLALAFSKRTSKSRAYPNPFAQPAPVVVLTEQMICEDTSSVETAEPEETQLSPSHDAADATVHSEHEDRSDVLKPAEIECATFSREDVEKLANRLWQEDGCPEGRALEHWLIAEARLLERPSSLNG